MAELKLIHGKQSEKYDHFREFDFETCRIVCTRLMGVVALKVTWRSRIDRRERMYQVIHLDYSEYGIDEYREFICTPGSADFADKKEEMNSLWNHFVYVMGGKTESIDAACMLRLIEDALPLASEDISREYDSEENRKFRAYARMRIGFMQDALNCEGITSADCSTRDAIETASPLRLLPADDPRKGRVLSLHSRHLAEREPPRKKSSRNGYQSRISHKALGL